jgi:hypothetical protein
VLRVPDPLGFYSKWLDGRIDDAAAGWRGRGLWATVSTRAPFHIETGKGASSMLVDPASIERVFHSQRMRASSPTHAFRRTAVI